MFGISAAQASSDLQKYQEVNAGALVYQMSRKRYEGAEGMRCVLHTPRLEEGMGAFLGAGRLSGFSDSAGEGAVNSGGSRVVCVGLPSRKGKPEVERACVLAVCGEMRLRVRYWSVNSGRASWRELAPHAFGYDGYRWHLRAWCYEREAFRDFVLGRIEKVEWPVADEGGLPVDEDWETFVEVKVRANTEMSDSARRAIEMDYGIRKNGVLKMSVRVAMRGYLLDHLRMGREDGSLPRHFEVG